MHAGIVLLFHRSDTHCRQWKHGFCEDFVLKRFTAVFIVLSFAFEWQPEKYSNVFGKKFNSTELKISTSKGRISSYVKRRRQFILCDMSKTFQRTWENSGEHRRTARRFCTLSCKPVTWMELGAWLRWQRVLKLEPAWRCLRLFLNLADRHGDSPFSVSCANHPVHGTTHELENSLDSAGHAVHTCDEQLPDVLPLSLFMTQVFTSSQWTVRPEHNTLDPKHAMDMFGWILSTTEPVPSGFSFPWSTFFVWGRFLYFL